MIHVSLETMVIIILVAFIIGLFFGVSLTRPRVI
jgi:hypothetical protein